MLEGRPHRAIENYARGLIIDTFQNNPTTNQPNRRQFYNQLISKICEEYSTITFEIAADYSGYCPSYFSKIFKKLSGMTFSEYLNIIRVENAITMIRSNRHLTMTEISSRCGFTTVRNFNRVFKEITGVPPLSLPDDYAIDTSIHISTSFDFDPTHMDSELI